MKSTGGPDARSATGRSRAVRSLVRRWELLRAGGPAAGTSAALGAASWLLAIVATIVALAPLSGAFSGDLVLPLVAGASILAVSIVLVAARFGGRATWSVSLSAAGAVVYTMLAGLREPLGFADLARGIFEGGAHLLSETLPIDAPRWVVVVPVLVAWIVAATAAELVVRRRAVGLAALAWCAGFVASLALTAGGPERPVVDAVGLLAVIGILAIIQRWLALVGPAGTTPVSGVQGPLAAATEPPAANAMAPEGATAVLAGWPESGRRTRSVPVRPLVLGVITLAAVLAITATVVPRLPRLNGAPVAPDRQPPVQVERPVVPTDAVAVLRESTARSAPVDELTVRADGRFAGYLALAVLDRYDGGVWQLDRTFVPSGGRVPTPPGTPSGGNRIVQQVHLLQRLPFPWMPVVGRPVDVSGVATDYSVGTGMVVPAQPIVAGTTYQVTSVVSPEPLGALGPAALRHPPAPSPDPADLSIPASVRPYLAAVVKALAAGAGAVPQRSLGFLDAVATELRNRDARVDPAAAAVRSPAASVPEAAAAASGTSFAAVVHAVIAGRQATPEQFATLFALVARYEGVPARLVTGFRVAPRGDTTASVPAGTTVTVTDHDAWTWVEIPVVGLGWVVVDPTPNRVSLPALPAPGGTPHQAAPPPPTPAVAVSHHSGHALAPPVHLSGSGSTVLLDSAVAAGVVLVLLLAVPVTASARRRRRRRRRSRGDVRTRVVGAWHEVLDTLDEHRCAELDPLTASEVADAAGKRFGADVAGRVALVGRAADAVLFFTMAVVSDADATAAWQQVREVRAGCRQNMPLGARIAASMRAGRGRRR